MTDEKIKPCPFCGAPAKGDDGFSPCESIFYVWCSNTDCGCSPSGRGERMFTVDEWNRRDESALAQAEEKGRLKGLREAAKLLDDNWYKTQENCIEAITRAAEGKS